MAVFDVYCYYCVSVVLVERVTRHVCCTTRTGSQSDDLTLLDGVWYLNDKLVFQRTFSDNSMVVFDFTARATPRF